MTDAKKPENQEDPSKIEIEIAFDEIDPETVAEAVIGGATAFNAFLGVVQGALKGAETSARKSPDTANLAPLFKDAANGIKKARADIRSEIKSMQSSFAETRKRGPGRP